MIRTARPDDGAVLADLILLSDSGLIPALFPGGPRTILTYLASHPRNPFSYEHAVVVELRGKVVAAAIGSMLWRMNRERRSTALLVARCYGLRLSERLIPLARAGAATNGLSDDDFYLNNIAVSPSAQGHGHGTRLIRYLEPQLRAMGARRVFLDVDPANAQAALFYASLGYREERTVTIVIDRHHCFEYRRLWKPLAPRR